MKTPLWAGGIKPSKPFLLCLKFSGSAFDAFNRIKMCTKSTTGFVTVTRGPFTVTKRAAAFGSLFLAS